MVQVQENQVDVPMQLQHERPVEVPVAFPADYTVQVPSHQVTPVEKQVPKIVPMANPVHQDVPHLVREERLIPVPQDVHIEAIKQVPVEQIRDVVKKVPHLEARGVEVVVNKAIELEHHKPVDDIRVKHHEIITQRPWKTKQKVIQTQEYYTNYITREEAVMGETQEVMGNYIEAERTGIEKIRPAAQREIIQEQQREVVTSSSGEVIYLNDTLHPGGATLIDGQFDRSLDTRQTGAVGRREVVAQRPAVYQTGYAQPVAYPGVMQYGAPVVTQEVGAYAAPVMQYGAPVMQYGAPASPVGAPVMQYSAPVGAAVAQAGFNAIDTNHDGVISRGEMNAALR